MPTQYYEKRGKNGSQIETIAYTKHDYDRNYIYISYANGEDAVYRNVSQQVLWRWIWLVEDRNRKGETAIMHLRPHGWSVHFVPTPHVCGVKS